MVKVDELIADLDYSLEEFKGPQARSLSQARGSQIVETALELLLEIVKEMQAERATAKDYYIKWLEARLKEGDDAL